MRPSIDETIYFFWAKYSNTSHCVALVPVFSVGGNNWLVTLLQIFISENLCSQKFLTIVELVRYVDTTQSVNYEGARYQCQSFEISMW